MTHRNSENSDLEKQIQERRSEVRTDISRLTDTTETLTDEVRKNTDANAANERLVKEIKRLVTDTSNLILRNQTLTIVIIVMVLMIGGLGYGNYRSNKTVERLANVLVECTTPGTDCTLRQAEMDDLKSRLSVLRFRSENLQTSFDAAKAAGNENVTGPIYQKDKMVVDDEITEIVARLAQLSAEQRADLLGGKEK